MCFHEEKAEIVKHMLDRGAISYTETLIHAIKQGHLKTLGMLVINGIHDNNMGMLKAAEEGNEDIVAFFLKRGANNYNSSIEIAAQENH